MNIYTPQQAADLLQVSRQTLLRLCRTGELKCSKVGRQWRISDSQIERFMTEHETTMTEDSANDEDMGPVPEPVKKRYTKQLPDNTRPPAERLRVPDVL